MVPDRPGWNLRRPCGVVRAVEGSPRDERELALRAQRGDARAFEELARPHWEVAFRVAIVVTGDPSEAEDAAQEGLVKAWRALGRFRVGQPFRPWLLKIVANEARNRRRGAGRRLGLAARLRELTPDASAASAESAALARAERQELLTALGRLSDGARSVLVYRYLLGLSEAETAAAAGIRIGTVKSRTARALAQLEKLHA